jgi:hypothetical protein
MQRARLLTEGGRSVVAQQQGGAALGEEIVVWWLGEIFQGEVELEALHTRWN